MRSLSIHIESFCDEMSLYSVQRKANQMYISNKRKWIQISSFTLFTASLLKLPFPCGAINFLATTTLHHLQDKFVWVHLLEKSSLFCVLAVRIRFQSKAVHYDRQRRNSMTLKLHPVIKYISKQSPNMVIRQNLHSLLIKCFLFFAWMEVKNSVLRQFVSFFHTRSTFLCITSSSL